MILVYRKRIDDAWQTFHIFVEDRHWEGVFDLANRHFCAGMAQLPDPKPPQIKKSNGRT